ncbi:MAG: hypothetical protein M3237_18290 [Actinomycetota bacterium]|nr:hypothetical protein [Actinomycetota bacterium]
MDLSALIFVALAVAWAVYLIPKALKHHEDDQRSRTVDRFSASMRVLARREPVDSRTARLVVEGAAVRTTADVAEPPGPAPISRAAAARATRRRRRVLALILLATATVGTLAGLAVIPVPYVAIPVGLLVAWLVACRLMVKSERATRTSTVRTSAAAVEQQPVAGDGPLTEEIAVVEATAVREPGSWDPVPVTLPTYVSKETAGRRSVRTIDLDSTGVWTSGHDESDSRLAREADEAREVGRTAEQDAEAKRAAGS